MKKEKFFAVRQLAGQKKERVLAALVALGA